MSREAMQSGKVPAKYLANSEAQGAPPNYKQTDIGTIPESWEIKKLGDLAAFRTGPFGSTLHKADYINGGVPLINPMHIVDGQLVPEAGTSVSEQAAYRLGVFRLKPGDIVMGRRGDMGRCAVVQQSHAGWLCGTGSLIIRSTPKMEAEFLQRVLTTDRVIGAIVDASVGSTMINLNQAALARLQIQCPPKAEQRAIAEALSDVDRLIASLDKLIEKKRAIKQAAMQQLLTGKTRLPGFSGDWETKRLGELGHFLKGSGVTRDSAQSGELACVRYGEIYTTHHDYIRTFHSWISAEVAASATRLEHGDLLFAGSGETKEEIGKCVAFVDDREAYAGGDIVILRPRGVDSLFLGYALNTAGVNRQKASRGQGDAVVHISAAALAQVELRMPKIEEQATIAVALSDMDAEIEMLERRSEKTRALKQGMMQQLLTGRVRLVEVHATPAQHEFESKAVRVRCRSKQRKSRNES